MYYLPGLYSLNMLQITPTLPTPPSKNLTFDTFQEETTKAFFNHKLKGCIWYFENSFAKISSYFAQKFFEFHNHRWLNLTNSI